jgi:hypothetical protein
MRSVFVLRPNRCGSTLSLPPRSRASSLAVSNARLTGAQTEDGSVAELRHRAGLFDRMWRAQVGRLADGSTMDRAPESLANRLSFGGAGTRCAVSGGRYARANCTNVQIIAATVNNSSSASNNSERREYAGRPRSFATAGTSMGCSRVSTETSMIASLLHLSRTTPFSAALRSRKNPPTRPAESVICHPPVRNGLINRVRRKDLACLTALFSCT